MPKGSYTEIIQGPLRRLEEGPRELRIEPKLVEELLRDIEAGGGKDTLPLLAFTLERLYLEYHAGGHLKLQHYEQLGRVKGSIEAAVERAFKAADTDTAIPLDRAARLALLRRGLIPWLAGIDPDTGAPRRRVALFSEIPAEARPLVDHLVAQRLLATDITKGTGEKIIEPAHEALLRQWGLLQGWLVEDQAALSTLENLKRAARDWEANARAPEWLSHTGDRLTAAKASMNRHDLSALLGQSEVDYLAECINRQAKEHQLRETATTVAPIRRIFYILAICAILVIDGNGALTFLLISGIVLACLAFPAAVVQYLGGAPGIPSDRVVQTEHPNSHPGV